MENYRTHKLFSSHHQTWWTAREKSLLNGWFRGAQTLGAPLCSAIPEISNFAVDAMAVDAMAETITWQYAGLSHRGCTYFRPSLISSTLETEHISTSLGDSTKTGEANF